MCCLCPEFKRKIKRTFLVDSEQNVILFNIVMKLVTPLLPNNLTYRFAEGNSNLRCGTINCRGQVSHLQEQANCFERLFSVPAARQTV
jgi:hypothetical protein